jgi:tetratricopeptide (TPR) repeat protein
MADLFSSLNNHESNTLGVALQLPASLALSLEAKNCFREGLAKLQVAEPAEAVELLSRTVELAPHFPEARICLGLAYALTHNIYPAIDQLETAGKLDPKNFAAHYTLAKLNFKLRIPQKGYEAASLALKCVSTIEQRRMLTELLKEERARERNGIARPWFNKPFNRTGVYLVGGGFAAAIVALLLHVRW